MTADAEYQSDGSSFTVTQQMKDDYKKFGYILVRNLLSSAEVAKVLRSAEEDREIQRNSYGRSDGKGKKSRMSVWNHPGNDVTGVLARVNKVAGTMEELMGGDEVYHYHSKLMMKNPHEGGAHIWHQDYGYWYNNGCLLPEMGSVFVPLDKCVKENGCLQILKGSQRIGRIDHGQIGDQARVNQTKLEDAKKFFDHAYVEMNPGDVLFFDCNLLHTSDQNNSDLRRWVLILAYNKKINNPTFEHHHALYNPLNKLPDSAIMECDVSESQEGKDFMKPEEDHSHSDKPK
ncbi:L-proline trans-4-hydroxylase-like isoform X1 [Oratosquilla oratoria]|uniref:L-proline trans-4-hydroxylase-like isoform X1 n=1 Tax=Oratosquilla oratoria TaxID=337810 RepID=UPI003F758BAB